MGSGVLEVGFGQFQRRLRLLLLLGRLHSRPFVKVVLAVISATTVIEDGRW